MDNHNQRNMLIALVLAGVLLLGWDAALRYFYPQAPKPAAVATQTAAPAGSEPKKTREGGLANPADQALEARDLATALKAPGRIAIAGRFCARGWSLVGS